MPKVESGKWVDVPKVELGEERVNNVLRVDLFTIGYDYPDGQYCSCPTDLPNM